MANEKNNGVENKFSGLPIAELIAAPLTAAYDSQKKLAQSAFEFMTEIGFNPTKGNAHAPVTDIQPATSSRGADRPMNIQVQAPFLGLVPLPALQIDDVQIDFQMEVTTTETSKATTNKELNTNVNSNFRFRCFSKGSVSVNSKVSSSRENTCSTNQTAKYQVHVSARQQPPTEGMSKLMDIMASCIEPLKISGSTPTPDPQS